jgi:phosphopantetheine--protein transferase-like protein
VVAAVSLNNPIGVDIENHVRERPFIEFSEQHLSPLELEKLEFLQGEERKRYFYSLWTVMESTAKLRGSGLDQNIFNGRWDSQHEFSKGKILKPKSRYSTYTTSNGGFTVSLATKSPIEEMLAYYGFSNDGLQLLAPTFSRGSFLLNNR